MNPSPARDDRPAATSIGLSHGGLSEFMRSPAAADALTIGPGTRLGDVTIVRLIDEGGMGRVFEGLQGNPCRTVAVKVIRPGAVSPSAARRFEHEARILGRLSHPGIARIYSMGLHDADGQACPYFVMEYVEDALPITAAAARRQLSTRGRVSLFRDVCRAVGYGHHKGVMHRDLKPGNILVDAAGDAKIIDFGVARTTDRDMAFTTVNTDAGTLVGTLAYMAPEQFGGDSDDLDVRVDVYSLGVVLHELLTGALPYDVGRRPVYDVARIVRDVEPRPLSAGHPHLRGDLSTIVAACLDKDRGRRYSSAAELAADLGRFLAGEPIAASPPSLVAAVKRLVRRHRMAAMAAAAVATTLVLAIVGISTFAVRAERLRQLADEARRHAIAESQSAAAERDAAERERARADAESELARRRLYIANQRALRSCIEAKNLRMARQLYAENVPLAGVPLPLEMHCVAAGLDDAWLVHDARGGAVTEVAYAPDSSLLAAATSSAPRTSLRRGVSYIHSMGQPAGWPGGVRESATAERLLFAVGGHLRHDRVPGRPDADRLPWPIRRLVDDGIRVPTDDWVPEPLAVSGDGRRMAVHSFVGTVHVIDRGTGGSVSMLDGQRGRIAAAAFSPDGSRLVARAAGGRTALWDADSGRMLERSLGGDRDVERFVFSPDGAWLAVAVTRAGAVQEVLVFAAADGRIVSKMTIGVGAPPVVAIVMTFTADGCRLITACQDRVATVWDVADGTPTGGLQGHTAVITAVAASPDGEWIATGAANGHIRYWHAADHRHARELMGHTGPVTSLVFRPDGRTLASGSQDGTIRIWPGMPAEPLAVLPDVGGLTAAVFSPDGSRLAIAPRDRGGVEIWNPATVERERTLAGEGGPVAEIAFSPEGGLVAAAFASGRPGGGVRVWSTTDGTCLWHLHENARGAVTVAFSADGSRLLTTSADGTVLVRDAATGTRLVAHAAGAPAALAKTHAVFGLGGARFASTGREIVDAGSGAVLARLPPTGQVTALGVSPDGRLLAVGVALGTVSIHDFETGRLVRRLGRHADAVRTVAFDAAGSLLAAGCQDGTCRVWDIRSGRELRQHHGHEGAVEGIAFTAGGRRLITSSTDGTVRIWDVELADELLVLPGHPDAPHAVAVNPDGSRLVTAAATGVTRVWGLSDGAIVAARQRAASAAAAVTSASGVGGTVDLGEGRHAHPLPRLLEGLEEGGEVGEVLPVEPQGREER